MSRWINPTVLPIYAVIVPLLAMRDDPYSAFNTSFDRLIGVVAGILLGLAVAIWLGPPVLAVVLVLLVGLFSGILLRVGATLNLQVSVSALIVFANPDPGQLAVARLWETLASKPRGIPAYRAAPSACCHLVPVRRVTGLSVDLRLPPVRPWYGRGSILV